MTLKQIDLSEIPVPPSFVLRLSLYFGAVFLLIGFHLPYFPVWLKWRGLTPAEIGIVLSAPLAVRIFFTPVVSFLADRFGDRRPALILLSWGALAGLALFMLAHGFWSILGVSIVASLFWTSIMPVTEAVAMDGVRRGGHDYGRMRLWGSLTFIVASFGGGLALQAWGPPSALWLMLTGVALTVAAAHLLPHPVGGGRLKQATAVTKIRIGNAVALMHSPCFLLFLFAAGITQSSHAIYYAFGTIHWQSQGISAAVIGMLWTTGVVAEILLFLFSGKLMRGIGAVKLVQLAAIAAMLRWSITAFSPPLWVLFPIQALHGLTFGAAHLGAIQFISNSVPDDASSTGQGLYASFSAGIAMGAGILVSGPLYAALAGHAYLPMAGLGLAGFLAALVLDHWCCGEKLIEVD